MLHYLPCFFYAGLYRSFPLHLKQSNQASFEQEWIQKASRCPIYLDTLDARISSILTILEEYFYESLRDHIDHATMSNSSENHSATSIGCGVLGRHPILSVVSFAAVGVGLGIGLSYWGPEDTDTKATLLQWIGLVGDLFIRALKAVVLPLIFVNVAVSVVQMLEMGRASSVGVKTIVLYTTTTLIASTIGLISILAFQGLFTQGEFEEGSQAFISLGCTEPGSLLTESMNDGSLVCVSDINATSPYSQFEIIDVSANFARAGGGGPADDLSMSDTVYQGVFEKLITANIFFAFVDGNFAAVVVFAIFFGVALGQVMMEKGEKDQAVVCTVSFFHEISKVLLKMINWIIACTPFAVLSLIANALGSQEDLGGAFANVGYLVAACLAGFIAHFAITDIGLFWFASGMNPFEYLKFIIPAQTTALACASSAATLPVTLECIKNTGKVPDDIRNFVAPLGATINMVRSQGCPSEKTILPQCNDIYADKTPLLLSTGWICNLLSMRM